MADPLSVSASIVGLVSLGIQVAQGLFDYYSSFRNQSSKIDKIVSRLNNLVTTFRSIETCLGQRQFTANEREIIASIEKSIGSSEDIIQELQGELRKFKAPAESDVKKILKYASRRTAFPFRDGYLRDLDDDISKIRDNLTSALSVLQLNDSTQIRDDVKDTVSLLNLVRASQLSDSIGNWLNASDPTISHNDACSKRHPRTGLWLIKNPVFQSWLQDCNSFIWIRGFAGAGKSVLCSTAIQHTFRHRRSDPTIGIAFFYFTFNDTSKQDLSSLLKTLILQLSAQLNNEYAELTHLHANNRHGTAPIPALMGILQDLIGRFQHVYLLVDAIDESPLTNAREQVLTALSEIYGWSEDGLHVLITSRDVPDIRRSVESYAQEIPMNSAEVDADIAMFISEQLQKPGDLKFLSDYHTLIEGKLTQRSKGNFRWVECQLKALAKCPRSKKILKKTLESLPESLDATYEKMLLDINPNAIDEAKRIFTLLCFAVRPMTVQEVISALAVELGEVPQIDSDNELQDVDDILRICPGFIEVDADGAEDNADPDKYSGKEAIHFLRIAHFSVQEYLVSSRIASHPKFALFHLSPAQSHAEFAQICLDVLCILASPRSHSADAFPRASNLGEYAADYWLDHYKGCNGISCKLQEDVIEMLKCPRTRTYWIRMCSIFNFSDLKDEEDEADNQTIIALYIACYLDLQDIAMQLIKSDFGEDFVAAGIQLIAPRKDDQTDINQNDATAQIRRCNYSTTNIKGAFYGNALQAAVIHGNRDVAQLLIDNGADINAQGGYYGNTLQAAAVLWSGNKAAIQLLIDNGTNVNTQGGHYGNALQAAAIRGYKDVVQLLIDNGADINAQGGEYRTALHAAAWNGDKDVVQLLIDNGADINAQGGEYGNALQAVAAWDGNKDVVQLLIDNGADINTQGGKYGNALQAAVATWEGNKDIIQLLIDNGADINAQGGEYGSALQAALQHNLTEIVQLLIDNGAQMKELRTVNSV